MSDLVFIELERQLASSIERLVALAPNPYSCEAEEASHLATQVLKLITSDRSEASEQLIGLIGEANGNASMPPVRIRTRIVEPAGSILPPLPTRGFDYGKSETDRLKRHFHTEWLCWLFSILFNHDVAVHPSEHGGGNRFHLVSPIPSADDALRDVGASTGGGEFHQHSDGTIYHDLTRREEIEAHLVGIGTSIDAVAFHLQRSACAIVEQMLCGRFMRVDATVLANVIAGTTPTHVGTTRQLQTHLRDCGFTLEQVRRLARMPVAQLAGPADGDISNFMGAVLPVLRLDEEGTVVGTRINSAPGRMRYVGDDPMDAALFERFVAAVRVMPVHRILLEPGDVLFLPNDHFGGQCNVTHGRGRLCDDEYGIDVGQGVVARRTHVRQYAQSRSRNGHTGFLESTRLSRIAHGL